MYRHYVLPRSYTKWKNFKVSFLLERKFTHYEHAMEAVLADNAENKNNAMYFCYVAPIMADLFKIYNTRITACEGLQAIISYLQDKAVRNPVAEECLQDFLDIAKKAGIEVRTVLYKDNS